MTLVKIYDFLLRVTVKPGNILPGSEVRVSGSFESQHIVFTREDVICQSSGAVGSEVSLSGSFES